MSLDVTALLQKMHQGEPSAQDQLLEALYKDLHARAQAAMHGQPAGHSLQATELVNEAYLKLVGKRGEPWASRHHFLSVASRAMRQVLVDHSRQKNTRKRSSGGQRVELELMVSAYEERAGGLPALDHALERMAEFDEEMVQAIELHFFGGVELQEVAPMLSIPKRSFDRRWQVAKAWLRTAVEGYKP